jgi:hypothetical protein
LGIGLIGAAKGIKEIERGGKIRGARKQALATTKLASRGTDIYILGKPMMGMPMGMRIFER